MFSLGTTEILVILVVALLIIGPSKLPDVARTLGKGMAEFRRMSSDVKKTVDLETKLSDLDRQEQDTAETAIGADPESGDEKGEASASSQENDSSPTRDGEVGDGTGGNDEPERADSEDSGKGSRA